MRPNYSHKMLLFAVFVLGCAGSNPRPRLAPTSRQTSSPVSDTSLVKDQRIPIWPGDKAPVFKIREWIRPGPFLKKQSDINFQEIEGVTVVVFFSTWCPLSRLVVPAQDKLQRELRDKGFKFLAVSRENADVLRRFTDQAGLQSIGVARFDSPDEIETYFPSSGSRSIPFVAVIGEGANQKGVLLWSGQVSSAGATDFADVLKQIQKGELDLQKARESIDRHTDCNRALDTLGAPFEIAWKEKDFSTLAKLTPKMVEASKNPDCGDTIIMALNDAAWTLLVDNSPQVGQFAVALELSRASMAAGGDEHPPAVDTFSRALFENDMVEAAYLKQKEAIELLEKKHMVIKPPYIEALAIYASAACEQGLQEACNEKRETLSPSKKRADTKQTVKELPKRISRNQAVKDLEALHVFLREHYAAYDDVAWNLEGNGSSWDKRNSKFIAALKEKKSWPRAELKEVLLDYLSVFEDRHLIIADDSSQSNRVFPSRGVEPHYADVRVQEIDGKMVIVETNRKLASIKSSFIEDVPIIGTPDTTQLKRAYLFPTLPRDGNTNTKEYLLGALYHEKETTASLRVNLVTQGGRKSENVFSLHRGKKAQPSMEGESKWELMKGDIPILRVRALFGDVQKMPLSASELRDHPAIILDLRGNGGGADSYVIEWCTRFSMQDFMFYDGYAEFQGGNSLGNRWRCAIDIGLPGAKDNAQSTMPSKPYGGKIVALVDNAVGSSGEVFAILIGQIKGSLLIGENTMGAITYGNVDQTLTLPSSRIWIRVGRTKFIPAGRPTKESFGLFPDYWIDSLRPIELIKAFMNQSSSRSR
ncbi:MAG: redoxin domain-containing protein [Deltaproteobacteria bacterium]|nr:redoxin domain-containing protein [Deltaproteobacteria bacterium]